MLKPVLVLAALVTALVVPSAWPEPSPPKSANAERIQQLVIKAAAVVDRKGKAAFADFRKKDSEWFQGDPYLFAYDMKGNVLLNPAFPQREGTNATGQEDAKGKLLHQAIIETAENAGSGWVDYWFPKPGHTEPSQKWTFVKKSRSRVSPASSRPGSTPNRGSFWHLVSRARRIMSAMT